VAKTREPISTSVDAVSDGSLFQMERGNARGGFTLLELLIVILLISLFGYLAFSSLDSVKKGSGKSFGIKDLVSSPSGTIPPEGIELLCIEGYKKCFVHKGGDDTRTPVPFSLPDIDVYLFDRNGNAQEADFGRVGDKKISLRIRYYPNGSRSELLLDTKDGKFVYIPSFTGEELIFDSISDAESHIKRFSGKFTDRGDYF